MPVTAHAGQQESLSIFRRSSDRSPRAPRHEPPAVPSLSTVRFPWGLEARLLNISSTGVLFESGTRVPPGSCQRLTLCGPDAEIEVPVSFVRSEVALVNGRGVKYHIAVAFAAPLDLDSTGTVSAAAPAPALSHLLSLLGAELACEPRSTPREAIERAVRQAIGALDARLHDGTPAPDSRGVALDVPLPAAEPVTLRLAFATGTEPSEAERRLARAAARVAALVLDFERP